MDIAQRVMCPGILTVGSDRSQGSTFCEEHRGRHVRPAHMGAECVARGKHAKCLTIIWIDRSCFFEQRLRDHVVLSRQPPIVGQPTHHKIPSVHAVGCFALSAEIFRCVKLRFDRADDSLCYFVLNREHVGNVAIVAFGPDMAAGCDIDKLCGDTHALAFFPYAALDDIADAEFFADLLQMDGFALVGEGRVARDHEEPAQFRQRSYDVFADAVGEVFLLRFATHVDERQHRYGRPIGQRQRGAQGIADLGLAARVRVMVRRLKVAIARRRRSEGPCARSSGSISAADRCRRSLCGQH